MEEMERLGWADDVGVCESVRECSALLHNIALYKWKWLLDPNHRYSVRAVYRFFTTTDEHVVRNLADDVRHKHISSKVSLFMWLLLHNRLPTKDELARRSILQSNDLGCAAGCGNSETAYHIFIGVGFLTVFGTMCELG